MIEENQTDQNNQKGLSKEILLDNDSDNQINEVILFKQNAHVTRKASTRVPAGVCRLQVCITAFSIEMDSPRAQVFGKGELLGVAYRTIPVKKTQHREIRELEEKQKLQFRQRKVLKNSLTTIEKQEQFLNSVVRFSETEVPKELKTKWVGTEEMNAMMRHLGSNFNTLYKERMELENELDELNEEIRVVDNRLKKLLKPGGKKKKTIEILFNSKEEQKVLVEASYVAKHASWQPLYKVDAALDLSHLQMTMFAKMEQKTGEAWEQVQLSVSNAEPMGDTILPQGSSWYIDVPRWKRSKSPVPAASVLSADEVMVGAAQEGAQEILPDALEDLELPVAAAAAPAPAPFQQAREQKTPLAFEYQLPHKVDLESGGEDVRLPLYIEEISTEFYVHAVPAKDQRAFLVCNAQPNQALLKSNLNIYLNGRFVGNTHLNEKRAGEDLLINFGPDLGVKINRKKTMDKRGETFFGKIERNTVAREIAFTIDIDNLKEEPVKVRLIDSIPVSNTDRIQIKGLDCHPAPTEKDFQDKEGVMVWELMMQPGDTRQIKINFHVKYPKDMVPYGI